METIGFFLLMGIILIFVFSTQIRGKILELQKEKLDVEKRATPEQESVVSVVARYIEYHRSQGSAEDDDTLAYQFFEEAYRDKKSDKEKRVVAAAYFASITILLAIHSDKNNLKKLSPVHNRIVAALLPYRNYTSQ